MVCYFGRIEMFRFALILLMSLAVSSQAFAATNNSSKHSDFFRSNLGISQFSGDTTLMGFKDSWENYSKKEITKYEKENNIKLFSVVKDNTRYGKTAFYVQAPSDGCYNRGQDCDRPNNEQQKRVEAHYNGPNGMGFVGNIWTTLSIYIPDEWEDSQRPQSLMQFHSSYSHYQSPFQLVLGSKRGLVWKHMSGGGFNVFEQGNHECSPGSDNDDDDAKKYCPATADYYTLIPYSNFEKNKWYDLVFNINFDKKDVDKHFHKIWIDGELVLERHNRTIWETMPGVPDEENRMVFDFGIYGTKQDGKFHAAYFDEIHQRRSCEKLKLGRLGYSCKDLLAQKTDTAPTKSEKLYDEQSAFKKGKKKKCKTFRDQISREELVICE